MSSQFSTLPSNRKRKGRKKESEKHFPIWTKDSSAAFTIPFNLAHTEDETNSEGDRDRKDRRTYNGRHVIIKTERPVSGKGSYAQG
jgi:hypothetical protein